MRFNQLKYPPLPQCPTQGGNPRANAGASIAVDTAPVKTLMKKLNLNFYSRAAGVTFALAKTRVALIEW
jgi:hypothetical protein